MSYPSVTIGFPCGNQIPWQTALGLAMTMRTTAKLGMTVKIQGLAGCSDVCDARSAVVTHFLQGDTEKLFWIDSDIEFSPVDFVRLVEHSKTYDVVAATYPLKREGREFIINGAKPPYAINKDGLLKVDSLGLGFTVVSRAALEKLVIGKPRRMRGNVGYEIIDAFRNDVTGEDVTFFNDLRALGYDVWLDPTIELGHVGQAVYRRSVTESLGIKHLYRSET